MDIGTCMFIELFFIKQYKYYILRKIFALLLLFYSKIHKFAK